MAKLAVLIPARHELFLKQTVEDVLAHSHEDTEVIVVADGEWPIEPLPQHPKLTLLYHPQAVGQRAAVNHAARITTAEYVMKLDAHCGLADGFDTVLLDAARELGPDVTQIPRQFNLKAFDWVCICGWTRDQGPTPTVCGKCGSSGPFVRQMTWTKRRRTDYWRFDRAMKFAYWGSYGERPEAQGDIVDVLSCLGACWFLSRDRFWKLGGLDEGHGSWGQMGTELACKSWLSGGRMVVNKRTWFAHLFRTQGGDFGFPYPIRGSEQEAARVYSRDLWLNDKWPQAVRPLSWLIEKFAPVPDWTPTKGIVYYSDNRPEPAILDACRQQIRTAAPDLPLVSVTLKPTTFGANVVLPLERGPLTMFKQILAGLEALSTDVVFLCEHDVLYHPSHFAFTPPANDAYYYNLNVWKVDVETGRAVTYETKQTSGLCANRELLITHYRERIRRVEAEGYSTRIGFEPGSHGRPERIDDVRSETWRSAAPNIDLRHAHNLTPSRWRQDQFRDQRHCQGWQEADTIPEWGTTAGLVAPFRSLVSA